MSAAVCITRNWLPPDRRSRRIGEGLLVSDDPYHVLGKSRHELEMMADERNSPIMPAAAARAEMVRRDQAHAVALVDKQIKAAHDVTWATKCATFAAIASAAGALIQALPVIAALFTGK
jgi:hypothetical protein